MNERLAIKQITTELDNTINGPASKKSIKAMRVRERKRVKQRKAAKKYGYKRSSTAEAG